MSKFVPVSQTLCESHVKKFVSQLRYVDRMLVLTGAGVSTESGIPDYRSKRVGLYARSNHKPTLHNDFMKYPNLRQRYWARNFLAWPNFSQAKCNSTHYAVSQWEQSDRFVWLITQNVDGLHLKAGSEMLTEIHGSGHYVKCMSCNQKETREQYQQLLHESNPNFMKTFTNPGELAPDGDVVLEPGSEKNFNVVDCSKCGGIIKTDVVFFGDFVQQNITDFCHKKVDECDGILVLGSSLSVLTGYRLVYQAKQQGKPIFIVNIGETRADSIATMKLEYKVSDVIKHI